MQGLDDSCTRVVEGGQLSENMAYLLLQPVGKLLGQNEDATTIFKVFLSTLLVLYYCCRCS